MRERALFAPPSPIARMIPGLAFSNGVDKRYSYEATSAFGHLFPSRCFGKGNFLDPYPAEGGQRFVPSLPVPWDCFFDAGALLVGVDAIVHDRGQLSTLSDRIFGRRSGEEFGNSSNCQLDITS